MIKIRVLYESPEEKDNLIQELQHKFNILKIRKVREKEGPYERIHISLKNK